MNSWSNQSISLRLAAAGVFALLSLSACGSAPRRPLAASTAAVSATGAGGGVSPTVPPAASAPGAAAAPAGPVPERAALQYGQALQLMKAGRNTDAELEFQQLSSAYPQFAGPQLNLGLLYLRDSRLPEAETAFKAAMQINPASPVAGNELGIVERKLGKFTDARSAYQQSIAAEPNYAPAHLNLGVLYDLYLAEPQKALEEFERYIALAGQNKQVSGWVIELRKRVGVPAAKKEPA